jgi:agmatine deiminase
MPAEWEPHAATWLVWPHNPETWPGVLEQAEREYRALVEALARSEPVHVLVQDRAHGERVRGRLGSIAAQLHLVPTNDSWMRDIGPTFVLDDAGGRLAIDWTFNSWGGQYPPWDLDDAVGAHVARLAGVRALRSEWVIEGGALEVDGRGTLIVTEPSVLDPRRNPGRTKREFEALAAELLGASRVVWLDAILSGDDTHGHVDDIARFVAPGRVVCARGSDPGDPDFAPLERCASALAKHFQVIDLPLPAPVEADGERLPASYANFYVANRAVLVPVFGDPADARALAVLAPLFPGRELVPIPSRTLVRGLGAVHCLTQQEPAPAAAARG